MRPAGGVPPGAPNHPAHDLPPRADLGEKRAVIAAACAVEPDGIRMMVKILQPGSASRRARAVVREVLQQARLDGDAIADAEVIVAELAANAEKHARPPYELRIFSLDRVPVWCEVVDSDPDLYEISIILNLLRSVEEIGLPLLAENGRGLLMAHQLSHGHCHVYPTTTFTTNAPGKAVIFALPTLSDNRLTLLCQQASGCRSFRVSVCVFASMSTSL
jgi:anti-sigma regulatory factor (Ser/Thr protein kinase)